MPERNWTEYKGVYYRTKRKADRKRNDQTAKGKDKADRTDKLERVYYILYKNRDGSLVEETAGKSSQDMTAAKASQIRAARIGGEPSNRDRRKAKLAAKAAAAAAGDRWTFQKIYDQYREQHGNGKSAKDDKSRWEKHLKPVIGDREPKDLAPLDVDRMRIRLGKKLSVATVRNILEFIRRLSNFAADRHLAAGMSFTVKLPKVSNEKTEDLSGDQMTALFVALAAAENQQVANLVRLALLTGMRRNEMLKLKWDDVNFDRGTVLLVDPKGGKDVPLPLSEAALDLLRSIPRRDNSQFVFPGRQADPTRKRKKAQADDKPLVDKPLVAPTKALVNIRKAAKLPADFRMLHGMRHCFASGLASSGVDLYVIQKLLGHKSPGMTMRYSHLRDTALRKAVETAAVPVQAAAANAAESNDDGKANSYAE